MAKKDTSSANSAKQQLPTPPPESPKPKKKGTNSPTTTPSNDTQKDERTSTTFKKRRSHKKPRRSIFTSFFFFSLRFLLVYVTFSYFIYCPYRDPLRTAPVCRNLDSLEPHLKPYLSIAHYHTIQRATDALRPWYKENLEGYVVEVDRYGRPAVVGAHRQYFKHVHPKIIQGWEIAKVSSQPHFDSAMGKWREVAEPVWKREFGKVQSWYNDNLKEWVDVGLVKYGIAYDFTERQIEKHWPTLVKVTQQYVIPAMHRFGVISRHIFNHHVYPFSIWCWENLKLVYWDKVDPHVQRYVSLYITPQLDRFGEWSFRRKVELKAQEIIKEVVEERREEEKRQGIETMDEDDFNSFIENIKEEMKPEILSPEELKAREAAKAHEEWLNSPVVFVRFELEAEQAKNLAEIIRLGDEGKPIVIERLAEIRRAALVDISKRFDAKISDLDIKLDKMAGKLTSYFEKLLVDFEGKEEKPTIGQVEEKVKEVESLGQGVKNRGWKAVNETLDEVDAYEDAHEDKEWTVVETIHAPLDVISHSHQNQLGLAWTWLDGVTYQDWAAFHHVTNTYDKYRDELKGLKSGTLEVPELPKESNIVFVLDQLTADIQSMGKEFESIIDMMVKKTQKKLRGQFPGVGFQDSVNEIVQSAASVIESLSSAASIGIMGTVEPTPTNFAESASSVLKSVTQEIVASYSEISAQATSISDEVRSSVASVASQAASVMSELGEAVYSKLPEAPSFQKLEEGEAEISQSVDGAIPVPTNQKVLKEEL